MTGTRCTSAQTGRAHTPPGGVSYVEGSEARLRRCSMAIRNLGAKRALWWTARGTARRMHTGILARSQRGRTTRHTPKRVRGRCHTISTSCSGERGEGVAARFPCYLLHLFFCLLSYRLEPILRFSPRLLPFNISTPLHFLFSSSLIFSSSSPPFYTSLFDFFFLFFFFSFSLFFGGSFGAAFFDFLSFLVPFDFFAVGRCFSSVPSARFPCAWRVEMVVSLLRSGPR